MSETVVKLPINDPVNPGLRFNGDVHLHQPVVVTQVTFDHSNRYHPELRSAMADAFFEQLTRTS